MELVYQNAAKIITTTLEKDISTKNAYYEYLAGRTIINDEQKQIYAIVMKVQKNRSVILRVCFR
jgi:hypothetical protein